MECNVDSLIMKYITGIITDFFYYLILFLESSSLGDLTMI